MHRRIARLMPARKRGPIAMLGVVVAASLAVAGYAGTSASAAPAAPARAHQPSAVADGLGQTSGLLPRNHLTEESAIQVDLTHETVRLPLYPGTADKGTPPEEKVWYVLPVVSGPRVAHC